ncbi:MAG: Verru_Chthon cassette protein D, partial [Terrimicrobiaceae bacterium]
ILDYGVIVISPPINRHSGCGATRLAGGCARADCGMSLIELLVVIAIMMIGTALVVPSMGGILQAGRITQAGETLTGQLRTARQHAITKNRPVEVRLLKFRAEGLPAGEARYGGFQYFEITEGGTPTAKIPMQRFPVSVFIDSGTPLSSLLGNASSAVVAPQLMTGTQLGDRLPGIGLDYDAIRFRFLPDGSTDLPRSGNWYLTLHKMTESDGSTEPPANYFTLQIEPSNGHVKIFRP